MDFTVHIKKGQPIPNFRPDELYRVSVTEDDEETHLRFSVNYEHLVPFTAIVNEYLADQATPFDVPTLAAIARSLTNLGVANAHQKTMVHFMGLHNLMLMDQECKKTPFDKMMVIEWFDQLAQYFASRGSPDGNVVKH